MSKHSLGRLKPQEIRDFWKDEAQDFTPWLAENVNIKLLGEALALELEVITTEESVGPFRADILCKEAGTDRYVLIENQLEKTDHTHLGQLITYASGLETVFIVWIAKNFSDEHRAALDWLNNITDETVNFFGLEIELWQIGNSLLAPKFNIVCKPNEWTKRKPPQRELTEGQKSQLEYWSSYKEYLENHGFGKVPKPQPQHWLTHSIGRSNFFVNAIASQWNSDTNKWDSEIRVELYIDGNNAKNFYEQIFAGKDEIENSIGKKLVWYNPEEYKNCRIYLRKSADITNRDDWHNQHEWHQEYIKKFREILSPLIKSLSVNDE